jgi:hypothetical protein
MTDHFEKTTGLLVLYFPEKNHDKILAMNHFYLVTELFDVRKLEPDMGPTRTRRRQPAKQPSQVFDSKSQDLMPITVFANIICIAAELARSPEHFILHPTPCGPLQRRLVG